MTIPSDQLPRPPPFQSQHPDPESFTFVSVYFIVGSRDPHAPMDGVENERQL